MYDHCPSNSHSNNERNFETVPLIPGNTSDMQTMNAYLYYYLIIYLYCYYYIININYINLYFA